MNLSEQGFEILQTLGYSIYARRSLLQKNEKHVLTTAASIENAAVKASSPQEVRKRAQIVSAGAQSLVPEMSTRVTWPVYHLSLLGVSGHVLAIYAVTQQTVDTGKVLVGRILQRCQVPAVIDYTQDFRWPLFPYKPVDQSRSVAVKALAGLIHKAHRQYRWQRILVFGEEAVSCTINQPYQQVLGQQNSYLGLPTIVSISVETMLADPQQRKIAWQHMQPVYALYTH